MYKIKRTFKITEQKINSLGCPQNYPKPFTFAKI